MEVPNFVGEMEQRKKNIQVALSVGVQEGQGCVRTPGRSQEGSFGLVHSSLHLTPAAK